MRKYLSFVVLMIFLFVSSLPVCAQGGRGTDALKKDIHTLQAGQQVNHREYAEIKSILRQKPAPAEFKETVINVGNDPSKGDKKAKLALIEFSDYQ
ncbi:MAG: hypothetical protein L6290_06815 [Thermodesulfovibrionales bacterium]|nr:hypothetical protein [Thermodesulfovibrionales bacterium]